MRPLWVLCRSERHCFPDKPNLENQKLKCWGFLVKARDGFLAYHWPGPRRLKKAAKAVRFAVPAGVGH